MIKARRCLDETTVTVLPHGSPPAEAGDQKGETPMARPSLSDRIREKRDNTAQPSELWQVLNELLEEESE